MRIRRNVLYLTPRLPFPPDKGDKIRTFHHLDRLAMTSNVYCACFVDQPADLGRADELRRWCKDVHVVPWTRQQGMLRAARGLLRGESFTASAYADAAMRKKIEWWNARMRFDAVVAFSSVMSPYALSARAARRVLDLCDVDSEKWRDYARSSRGPARWLYAREARKLRALEQAYLEAFDTVTVINGRERAILDPNGDEPCLAVVPNGVRLFDGACDDAARCGPTVGFLGAMDYRPNVEAALWYAQKVWPAVVRQLPEARLLIIGRNPDRRIQALARLPGVLVTGEVRDPSRYVARCRVMVAPLRIVRGIPNKVLESMAARRPVLATSDVAAALGAQPGRHLVVADEADRFVTRTIDLCCIDEYTRRIGRDGHDFVATRFAWPDQLDAFERAVFGESHRRSARTQDVEAVSNVDPIRRPDSRHPLTGTSLLHST